MPSERERQGVGVGGKNSRIASKILADIEEKPVTGSLAPADFSGAVFTHKEFQKVTEKIASCPFYVCTKMSIIEGSDMN